MMCCVYPGMYGNKYPMQSIQPENQLDDIEVPLYAEPFNSWRTWDLIFDGDRVILRSITYKVEWPFQEPLHAICVKNENMPSVDVGKHDTPDLKHGCGIYSVKVKKDCQKWNMSAGQNLLRVVGEIKIWGKTLCFKEGYISEFAYPRYLHIDPDKWERVSKNKNVDVTTTELADALGRNYDVPIVIGS